MLVIFFTILSSAQYVYNVTSIHSHESFLPNSIVSFFDITQGIFHILGSEYCEYIKDIGCLYNNQFTPVGFVSFPEKNNPEGLSYRMKIKYEKTDELYVLRWPLDTDEVILIGGSLFENLKYFGFQNYICSRNNYGFHNFILGSLGNSVNNFRINSKDGKFVIIATVNKYLQDLVEHEITSILNPNYLPFPIEVPPKYFKSTKLRYGTTLKNDMFMITARFAFPGNVTSWHEYVENLPIWVIKLKLKKEFKDEEKITEFNPAPILLPEVTLFDERVYKNDIK